MSRFPPPGIDNSRLDADDLKRERVEGRRADLRDHFGELRTDLPPHWVRPTLVVEVEYRQRLKDALRHAALKGLRPEKKPGLHRRWS